MSNIEPLGPFVPELVLEKTYLNGQIVCKVSGRVSQIPKIVWMTEKVLANEIYQIGARASVLFDSFNNTSVSQSATSVGSSSASQEGARINMQAPISLAAPENIARFNSHFQGNNLEQLPKNPNNHIGFSSAGTTSTYRANHNPNPQIMGRSIPYPHTHNAQHNYQQMPQHTMSNGFPYHAPPNGFGSPSNVWPQQMVPKHPNINSMHQGPQRMATESIKVKPEFSGPGASVTQSVQPKIENHKLSGSYSNISASTFPNTQGRSTVRNPYNSCNPANGNPKTPVSEPFKNQAQATLEKVKSLLEAIRNSSFEVIRLTDEEKMEVLAFVVGKCKSASDIRSSFEYIFTFLRYSDPESQSICFQFLKLFLVSGVPDTSVNFTIYVENFGSKLQPRKGRETNQKEIIFNKPLWGKPFIPIDPGVTSRYKSLSNKLNIFEKKVAPSGSVTYLLEKSGSSHLVNNLRDLTPVYPALEEFEHNKLERLFR